ncbi:preprotein translocase subunit YajC [uncultured Anaerococcus sp.]|uniref:preprotein translocase subunit YajC n=1 Tax=uncultured Anaerococcus sp. TaxID=293428 RepID=UPI00288BA730|nr:preprotein translocase subunit YajC [uncultured Anaerococcus sp.]
MPAEIARTSLVLLAFIAIFGVISQILSHRSLKKKKKYFEQLHKDLKPGKEVMLTGGIYGKIVSLKEDTAIINVAKDVNIKVSRYSISEIVN